MNSFLDPVELSIAPKWLRVANYFIDLIVFLVLFAFLFIILELLGTTVLTYLELNPLIDRLISASLYIIFMGMQEILFKGRSVGKFLTGTKVVMMDGSHPEIQTFMIRNLCRIIPFDGLSFLGSVGWHDSIPKTRVVIKKEFEQNKTKFNSIDQIGKSVE